ncbi:hypothetical protein VTL71DRAFT_5885 [Oculimacula yallundae]|uniref:Uncharacterized protein n=1 Tax=Oculimacula yallundae TaxID=86028 RepID=A0ABR4C1C1_9HELO
MFLRMAHHSTLLKCSDATIAYQSNPLLWNSPAPTKSPSKPCQRQGAERLCHGAGSPALCSVCSLNAQWLSEPESAATRNRIRDAGRNNSPQMLQPVGLNYRRPGLGPDWILFPRLSIARGREKIDHYFPACLVDSGWRHSFPACILGNLVLFGSVLQAGAVRVPANSSIDPAVQCALRYLRKGTSPAAEFSKVTFGIHHHDPSD